MSDYLPEEHMKLTNSGIAGDEDRVRITEFSKVYPAGLDSDIMTYSDFFENTRARLEQCYVACKGLNITPETNLRAVLGAMFAVLWDLQGSENCGSKTADMLLEEISKLLVRKEFKDED